jgi:transposase-like protein
MFHTYLKKRNKPDAPEAVRAVLERRLSVRTAASRYGITHTALHYRI